MVVMWRGDVPLGFASRKGAKREPPPGLEAVLPRAAIGFSVPSALSLDC